MLKLVESIIKVSEKAANIARTCRQEEHLFKLLVQEKSSGEANPRFVQDFKTLADVLIQECVKHDIGKLFPALAPHIKGEENNVFCNTLGETVCIEIQETADETASLLEKVLDGDKTAANLLAMAVHRDVATQETIPSELNGVDIDINSLAVWIDPIDSTAEYINAKEHKSTSGIYNTGLQCVTVLIGIHERNTGVPIIGVVNQPFYELLEENWKGRCYWGVSFENHKYFSATIESQSRNSVISISSSETEELKSLLRKQNFTLVEAAGAGYKILTVITGQATAYVLSKKSTYKWDTCGPQAILRALGGEIISFDDAKLGNVVNVDYKEVSADGTKIDRYCNETGIVAFRNQEVRNRLLGMLHV